VPERRLHAAALIVVPIVGIASGVVWQAAPVTFAVVAGCYVVAHLVAVPTPTGRHLSFAPSVAAISALLTGGSPVVVLGAAAAALPLSWLAVHVRFGRRAVDDAFPAELAGLLVFGLVFAAGTVGVSGSLQGDTRTLLVFAAAGVSWFIVVALSRAALSEQGRFHVRRLVVLRAIEDWPAYVALFASAALYGLTVGAMGVWSVPLAGLPYVFSHVSLDRLQATDTTYRETMLALSRIPEAGGLVAAGHAERCAELAVALGAELGMSGEGLRRLEYAALLHDIGRVVLANPMVASGEYDSSDVSRWSSAIISEARYLEPVAELVSAQNQPYRRPGEPRDEATPRGAQILRVVAAYDGELNGGVSPTESLEELHRGSAYDYDPEVVAALRRVLQRRRVIAA
jgi:hypothetical protein